MQIETLIFHSDRQINWIHLLMSQNWRPLSPWAPGSFEISPYGWFSVVSFPMIPSVSVEGPEAAREIWGGEESSSPAALTLIFWCILQEPGQEQWNLNGLQGRLATLHISYSRNTVLGLDMLCAQQLFGTKTCSWINASQWPIVESVTVASMMTQGMSYFTYASSSTIQSHHSSCDIWCFCVSERHCSWKTTSWFKILRQSNNVKYFCCIFLWCSLFPAWLLSPLIHHFLNLSLSFPCRSSSKFQPKWSSYKILGSVSPVSPSRTIVLDSRSWSMPW